MDSTFMVDEDPFQFLPNIVCDFDIPEVPFTPPTQLDQLRQQNDHFAPLSPDSFHLKIGRDQKRDRSLSPVEGHNGNCKQRKKQKLMIHKEVERQRRQGMASLHRSLRTLLPLEYVKGKRSMSDHLHETVKYIKHLEAKNQSLRDKKSKLKTEQNGTSTITNAAPTSTVECDLTMQTEDLTPEPSEEHVGRTVVKVVGREGVEVVVRVVSLHKDGGVTATLSRVLKCLAQEGLDVTSCFSSRVGDDDRIHCIQAQVGAGRHDIDVADIQRKLASKLCIN